MGKTTGLVRLKREGRLKRHRKVVKLIQLEDHRKRLMLATLMTSMTF
jgi:hypothetical protein